jgi:ketosteroid isomerase-like protein
LNRSKLPTDETWESLLLEVDEITEIGDDRVLVCGQLTTRGKASGVETTIRGCLVFWIANGKITRRQVFLDRDEALEAVGLRE